MEQVKQLVLGRAWRLLPVTLEAGGEPQPDFRQLKIMPGFACRLCFPRQRERAVGTLAALPGCFTRLHGTLPDDQARCHNAVSSVRFLALTRRLTAAIFSSGNNALRGGVRSQEKIKLMSKRGCGCADRMKMPR
jgi:hypothetical protein